ncbi:EF-hand domain-containing protein [Phytomonospora sp. NPDC050363]|uniref:EF-hand domain-containing protein n=1 Tax=Phytomonospora sp. NPDC050363 TaxID=3155642 RepID=UPI0033DE7F2A
MNKLLKAKAKRYFESLDTTGDGRITEADMHNIAERHATANGFAQNSPDARSLRDATVAFWDKNLKQMDTSGNGEISLAEFTTAVEQLAAAGVGQYETLVWPTADAYFDLCDHDGSGELNQEEFLRIFGGAASVPADESIATFRQLDKDNSGVLSRAEYHAALKEFYYSTDPSAVGIHLFGRVDA